MPIGGYALAFTFSALDAPSAFADMTVNEKKMEAAAIVLGAASQMGGIIVVEPGGRKAYIRPRPGFDLGDKVTFQKMDDCVYAEIVDGSQEIRSQYSMIDFSKLRGVWHRSGNTIDFLSKGTAHCSSYIKGCWQGSLHIIGYQDHQQMIDDVSYVIRHGCDASVDDNPDPDPH